MEISEKETKVAMGKLSKTSICFLKTKNKDKVLVRVIKKNKEREEWRRLMNNKLRNENG